MDKRIVTKRIVLQTGFSCNARCTFCYYRKALETGKVKDLSFSEICIRLKKAINFGKNKVDLSGGEPTIRKDIFKIAEYARDSGYQTVCIITNGLKTRSLDFCRKLQESGVDELLFSIHSPVEDDHDHVVGVKGAFRKVIQSISNAEKLGISYRTNTVVSDLNYDCMDQLYDMLKPFNPAAVNLLVYNPSMEDSRETGGGVDYHVAGSKIREFISRYEKHLKTINVRWLPFCFLKGYEKNIRTQWQKFYEDQEWDPYFNIRFNKGNLAAILSFLTGCLLYPFKAPKYGRRDLYTLFNEIISCFRMTYYYSQKGECKTCGVKKICTGIPRNYNNGTVILENYQNIQTRDPLFFCGDYPQNFESLRISTKE
jgi:MoaA/NifB/PqqE/SkfB family radical SAM enzyme